MTQRAALGFTLVELLIAVALLGALTAVAYGALRLGGTTWRRTAAQRQLEADREATIAMFRRAVTEAYPAFASRDPGDRRIWFDGETNALRVLAPLPAALEAGVMAREGFYANAAAGHHALVMSWVLDLPGASGAALPEHVTALTETVTGLRFDYFGSPKEDEAPAWHDTWRGQDHLPTLVRLRVWREAAPWQGAMPWIDVTNGTEVTASVDCVYLPGEAECRRLP